MKGKIGAVTQVSLALLLSLSLGFMTAMPSMAQESAQEKEAEYDLGCPAAVTTTITCRDAEETVSIEDDQGQLGENDYSVTRIDDDRATLTVNDSYLKGRLIDIDDKVVLTIECDVGLSATLTITAVRYPAVDPTTALYDLDDRADFLETSINWGCASDVEAITDGDEYELQEGLYYDYIVLGNTLLMLNDYLNDKLEEDGDKVELTIVFDHGGSVTFTIEAVETHPDLSPTPNPALYDLFVPTDVEITITWRAATKVVSIVDDKECELEKGATRDYKVDGNTLTILNSYLKEKLEQAGDSVVLTIEFDVGVCRYAITAVDEGPSIAPETAEYTLDGPAAVNTTITWGAATEVVSITENGNPLTPDDHYTVGQTVEGEVTLTILNDYLADELKDIGHSVELRIKFDFGQYNIEHYATFTITAIGTHPSISPRIAPYDLGSPAAVNTTIVWRDAKEGIVTVKDDEGQLEENDYSVTPIDGDTASLAILNSYLEEKLEQAGNSVELTIEFDVGVCRYTITAVDEYPSIDPETAEYDLDGRAHVETTITWQAPTRVISIEDNERQLEEDYYSVTLIDDDTATLTIFREPYLKGRLRDTGYNVTLTIGFDVGLDATFTITAVRYPAVYPTTTLYNLDDRADFLETSITWGCASDVEAITDGDEYELQEGLYYDYMVLGNTLLITEKYLRNMDIGDEAKLRIGFGDDCFATLEITLEITAIGTHPTISPPALVYDLDDPADIQATITWGAATKAESIVGGDDNPLEEGKDYWVTYIEPGVSELTISDTYPAQRLKRWVDEVVLTIDFDVGNDADLYIRPLGGCFIATAAYGTPMAEEIHTLREFRDQHLLTNAVGQAFVDFYYRVSPPMAEFITEHPALKPIVRIGLLPAVAMSAVVVNTTPARKMTLVGLLVLVSVALAVWATRRRGRGPEYTRGQSCTIT